MNNDFEVIERRTIRYFYEDGMTEVYIGVVFLALGASLYGQYFLPVKSVLRVLSILLTVPAMFALAFLLRRGMRFFKQRVTYPRTGFVSYKKENRPSRRRRGAILGALFGFLFCTLIIIFPAFEDWLPALDGAIGALVCLLMAGKSGLPRFRILAGLSLVTGLFVAVKGFGGEKGGSLYFALFGATLLLSGLVTLVLYLRRQRPAGEGADES
jgi:hypothetical protein